MSDEVFTDMLEDDEIKMGDIPGGSWEEQCLASRELKDMFKREAASLRCENKRLWEALSMVRHNAIAIQNVRWGHDGDCGVTRLANCIEEDCDRAMISPHNT